MSDFRPEVEIWLFCTCAMTNIQYNHYLACNWVLHSYWLLIVTFNCGLGYGADTRATERISDWILFSSILSMCHEMHIHWYTQCTYAIIHGASQWQKHKQFNECHVFTLTIWYSQSIGLVEIPVKSSWTYRHKTWGINHFSIYNCISLHCPIKTTPLTCNTFDIH